MSMSIESCANRKYSSFLQFLFPPCFNVRIDATVSISISFSSPVTGKSKSEFPDVILIDNDIIIKVKYQCNNVINAMSL